VIDELRRRFPEIETRPGLRLSELSTLHIGGPAEVVIEISVEAHLVDVTRWLSEKRTLMIGGGSNILFDSDGFDGVVIRNRVSWIRRTSVGIEASAGTPLQDVLAFALEQGLEGLEFAAGIPGSFGGGIVGNAGAWGTNLGGLLEAARLIMPEGHIELVGPDHFAFGYRSSRLQTDGEVLLSAELRLAPARDIAASERQVVEFLSERAAKHPGSELPSAGSWFKNPDLFDPNGRRMAAGLLLDRCRCKGLTIGGAQVFEKHANIIVNRGGATSGDVLALAAEMRRRVAEQFGVSLEPEVRYVPRRPLRP